MIEEVENLIREGYNSSVIESKGIEYKWIIKYIKREISREELISKISTASWQYAKRQNTWNKKYLPFAKIIEVKD